MSAALMRSECRKFAPNIFNKSKCTNCFRQKEEHSAEALESNRATRKVAKYGYLFVAPGWDFSNPLNRNKRWQRRWFVLYDDGELSYSVDEHPDTVPQASIDMNKVLEVADAEEVTGNAFSLAITAPDRVHFVKGTCREECRSWCDVLSVFPRSKGRHKRNATFPGGQSTSLHAAGQAIRASTPQESRPRFGSCHSEPRPIPHAHAHPHAHPHAHSHPHPPLPPHPAHPAHPHSLPHPHGPSAWLPPQGDAFPTRERGPALADGPQSPRSPAAPAAAPADTRPAYRDQPASSASPPTRDKVQSEEKARSRRMQSREKRGARSGRSFSEDLSGLLPGWPERPPAADTQNRENDVARRILFDYEDDSRRDEKLKDIADSLTRPRARGPAGAGYHRGPAGAVKPTRDRDRDCGEEERRGPRPADAVDGPSDKLVRGDPDGCGLDLTAQRYSPSSELRVDLPAEDLLNIKKGWLMKQGLNQEFTKHWFVLRSTALMYYRDPSAEDKGILDGVLDLSGVRCVSEVQVARNYGFQTTTWDEQRYVLSAVTAGIRNNWMSAIRRAAGLQEPAVLEGPPLSVGEKLERELDSSQGPVVGSEHETSIVPSAPLTPRSVLFSSDEEYRTASEGGRRGSEDWGEPLTPLPPSPPLNRTPISRVKEKARSRVYRRSRSSPPSSRRSTLDSVRPDDLLLACCGELPESDAEESTGVESVKSSVFDSADSQTAEVEELKRQLSGALCDVGCAEKELMHLRQHKHEMAALEKQVRELLGSLQRAERQLEQRSLEVAELEQLKHSYKALLQEHEELLARWREHSAGPDWRALYQQMQDRYRQDSEEWQRKLRGAEAALEQASSTCEQLGHELAVEQGATQRLHDEAAMLQERLGHGIEENEGLYQRVRDLEARATTVPATPTSPGGRGPCGSTGGLSASRERGRSVDSLSDLTNIELEAAPSDLSRERLLEAYEELRGRFEKAVAEIRAMRRELRESHALYDDLELACLGLRQEASQRESSHRAESTLMASRVQDLTLKLSAAEKQVRGLKQKLSKNESRDKRRSLSLKGREQFQICKELEDKLGDLEAKIVALESGRPMPSLGAKGEPADPASRGGGNAGSQPDALKAPAARLRRKSLDSATSSEPMKVLIRLSSLEAKVKQASERLARGEGLGEDVGPCQAVAVNVESPRETPPHHLPEGECETGAVAESNISLLVARACDQVQECLGLVEEATGSAHPALAEHLVALEQRLGEVHALLEQCDAQCPAARAARDSDQDSECVSSAVQGEVGRLEALLRRKLSSLLEQRERLRSKGELSKDVRAQLLAEKLAYETVLIQRIALAVLQCEGGAGQFRKWLLDNEVLQSTRLMSTLKSKLNGKDMEEPYCESSVEYLTRVLTKKLLLQRKLASQVCSSDTAANTQLPVQGGYANSGIISLLLKRQQELHALVQDYRSTKLESLAEALTRETLSYMSADHAASDENSCEERVIREAWRLAQEAVNRELVQAEISHVSMRCGQLYESQLAADCENSFSFLAAQRSLLEQWSDAVERALREDLEASLEELTCRYEASVERQKKQPAVTGSYSEKDAAESRKLLSEFTDVMAHKALIDARISLLLREVPLSSLENVFDPVATSCDLPPLDSITSSVEDQEEEIIMGLEFEHLFQHFSDQCAADVEEAVSSGVDKSGKRQVTVGQVMKSLRSLEQSLGQLRLIVMSHLTLPDSGIESEKDCEVRGNGEDDEGEEEETWAAVCSKCASLQGVVAGLAGGLQGAHCQRCQQLQTAMSRLHEQHELQVKDLKFNHEQTMLHLQNTLEDKQTELENKHHQESEELKAKAVQLQKQLDALDSEYNQQVAALRDLYERNAAPGAIDRLDQRNIQQRYHYEVEHLKALCEKGLVAMEHSHRRMVSELEQKHHQELEQMRQEKDQALAEETQATLAALDAMRKAHEIEVQKEIAKFKTEFMKKVQQTKEFGALQKEHVEEIEGIKREILSLSEKYSSKCVESATLEEQLAQAHERIMQLDAKNRRLKAQVEGSDDADLSLHGREASVGASQPGEEDPVLSLWSRLQLLAEPTYPPPHSPGCRTEKSNRGQSVSSGQESCSSLSCDPSTQSQAPPALSSVELNRCLPGSYITYSGEAHECRKSSPFLWITPLRSPSASLPVIPRTPSPVGGSVAERKKLFEQ